MTSSEFFVKVRAGTRATMALTRDGAVFLWGSVYDRASHSMLSNSHEVRGERGREGVGERGEIGWGRGGDRVGERGETK